MPFFFIPEFVRVEVGLDADTRGLVDRWLALSEGKQQAQIDALAQRLKASSDALRAALVPDPNPND